MYSPLQGWNHTWSGGLAALSKPRGSHQRTLLGLPRCRSTPLSPSPPHVTKPTTNEVFQNQGDELPEIRCRVMIGSLQPQVQHDFVAWPGIAYMRSVAQPRPVQTRFIVWCERSYTKRGTGEYHPFSLLRIQNRAGASRPASKLMMIGSWVCSDVPLSEQEVFPCVLQSWS